MGTRTQQPNVRNFCIIAHIDHGKSTFADRLLEMSEGTDLRNFRDQMLDSMDLEREKGITIKSHTVSLKYLARDGKKYTLNLIDTPGHVDFSYEVSRALAACEGAILLVDASQGVQAQTISNALLAMENNLCLIPALNKIDLPDINVRMRIQELRDTIGINTERVPLVSAKSGEGVRDLIELMIETVQPPPFCPDKPLKALIFDSQYNAYRGIVVYVRVMEGTVQAGTGITMMHSGKQFEVSEVGIFTPEMKKVDRLVSGDVGYIIANIKTIEDTLVGDTITSSDNPADQPLAGYKKVKPVVFCGLYPAEAIEYDTLRETLKKFQLNDAAFVFQPETSQALGFGFRCGFLGLLHMEITIERLQREYGLSLIVTYPSVVYEVVTTAGETISLDNPVNFPSPSQIREIREPFLETKLYTPPQYVGGIMQLCEERRGNLENIKYYSEKLVELTYELPLAEVVVDFYDKLKSRSQGYASMEYEFKNMKRSDLVKLNILINHEPVDALSLIVHRDRAYERGHQICKKLKEVIPRQLFSIPIQAAIGSKIIARETIRAMKKNVLAKCYGGDVTRKRKLLEKQKAGKKKMKLFGKVRIPKEAFFAVMKL